MELLLKCQYGIHSGGIQYSPLYEALAPEWWTLGEVTTYCGSESASERTISGNIGQNSFLFDWTSPVVSNLHCIGILNTTFMRTSGVIIFKRALQWGKDAWRCIPQKNIATLRKAFIGKKNIFDEKFHKGASQQRKDAWRSNPINILQCFGNNKEKEGCAAKTDEKMETVNLCLQYRV